VVEDPTCQNKNFHKFLSGNVERIAFPPFQGYPSFQLFSFLKVKIRFLHFFFFLNNFFPLVFFLYFSVSLLLALHFPLLRSVVNLFSFCRLRIQNCVAEKKIRVLVFYLLYFFTIHFSLIIPLSVYFLHCLIPHFSCLFSLCLYPCSLFLPFFLSFSPTFFFLSF
jgi:hypothetical protein